MRVRKRQLLGLLTVQLVMLVLTSSAIATVVLSTGRTARFVSGGSDGVGGIPYAGGPQSANFTVPYLLTIGLVVDSGECAVPNAPVIVMASEGTIIGATFTDDSGLFAIVLPATAGLTVSLPLNGVVDYPIEAGTPVLIVVP